MKLPFNWRRYRKLIPAIVGVVLLISLHRLDIKIPGFDMVLIDWLIGAGTVFGVRQAKNDA